MPRLVILVACALLFCSLSPSASYGQATFYVSFQFGNDTTGDGSLSSPLQTAKAVLDHYETASGGSLEVVYLRGTHRLRSGATLSLFGDSAVTARAFAEAEDGALPEEFVSSEEEGVTLLCEENGFAVFSFAAVTQMTLRQLNLVNCDTGVSVSQLDVYGSSSLHLSVRNCSFVGGTEAIRLSPGIQLDVEGCSFERLSGIAISALFRSSVNIVRSSFEKCLAGALRLYAQPLYDSALEISDCRFVANVNTIVARLLSSGSRISNCYFERNYAARGGALYLQESNHLSIGNSVFYRNSAQTGGAIYTTRSAISLNNCQFLNNGAAESAGVAYLGGGARFDDSVFKFNFARRSGGGVIRAFSAGDFDAASVEFVNCEISCNKASAGGVVESSGAAVTFTSCNITQNQAIFNEDTDTTLFSAAHGGVVISSSPISSNFFGTVRFMSCTVAFNSAIGGDGGVVWMDGYKSTWPEAAPDLLMEDSAFIANSAQGGAGGVASTRASVVIVRRTELRDNEATEGGFWHCWNDRAGPLVIEDSPLSAQGTNVFSCESSVFCNSSNLAAMCDCDQPYDSCNTCGGSSNACPFPTLPEGVENDPQPQQCTLQSETPSRSNVTLGDAKLKLFENPEFELFSGVNSTLGSDEDVPKFKLRYRKFEEFEFGEFIAETDLDNLEKVYTVSEALQAEEYNVNYTSLFSNGLIFQASNWLYSKATNLSFGSENFQVPSNSLKFTLDVNYPFFGDLVWNSINRELKIWFAVEVVNHPNAILSANVTKTSMINGTETVSEIVFTSESKRAKAQLVASFISTGLIDGNFGNVIVAYEGDFQFSVSTAYCPANFVFDPNFSTLLDVYDDPDEGDGEEDGVQEDGYTNDDGDEDRKEEKNDDLNFGLVIGVPAAVLVALLAFGVGAAVSFHIAKKKKRAKRVVISRTQQVMNQGA
ncbi:hypothetical protein QOT17_020902 [Balamuthia mandrillaris]